MQDGCRLACGLVLNLAMAGARAVQSDAASAAPGAPPGRPPLASGAAAPAVPYAGRGARLARLRSHAVPSPAATAGSGTLLFRMAIDGLRVVLR